MDNENVKAVAKKIASSEGAKKAVKKLANNKTLKKVGSKAQKTIKSATKTLGIDMTTIISLASKNKTIVEALAKIGLKKETNEPEAAGVQRLRHIHL